MVQTPHARIIWAESYDSKASLRPGKRRTRPILTDFTSQVSLLGLTSLVWSGLIPSTISIFNEWFKGLLIRICSTSDPQVQWSRLLTTQREHNSAHDQIQTPHISLEKNETGSTGNCFIMTWKHQRSLTGSSLFTEARQHMATQFFMRDAWKSGSTMCCHAAIDRDRIVLLCSNRWTGT